MGTTSSSPSTNPPTILASAITTILPRARVYEFEPRSRVRESGLRPLTSRCAHEAIRLVRDVICLGPKIRFQFGFSN